jgi:hypothetical protein
MNRIVSIVIYYSVILLVKYNDCVSQWIRARLEQCAFRNDGTRTRPQLAILLQSESKLRSCAFLGISAAQAFLTSTAKLMPCLNLRVAQVAENVRPGLGAVCVFRQKIIGIGR